MSVPIPHLVVEDLGVDTGIMEKVEVWRKFDEYSRIHDSN